MKQSCKLLEKWEKKFPDCQVRIGNSMSVEYGNRDIKAHVRLLYVSIDDAILVFFSTRFSNLI